MQIRRLPSRETLMELLSYAPDTGELLWKAKPATSPENKCFNTKCASKPAGSLGGGRPDGAIVIFWSASSLTLDLENDDR